MQFALLLAVLPSLAVARLSLRQTDGDTGDVVYRLFHIDSEIVARYATTTISSVVLNSADVSRELSFQVQLPETAFISNFTMTVNGSTFFGMAEEKEKAAQDFEQRQNAGENVGLVESRGTNLFTIRINTAALTEATFVLQYEELIVRELSRFQQILNLNPGGMVEDFQVSVRAVDEQGVVFPKASDYVSIDRISSSEVIFSYAPSLEEQAEDTELGLARDMVVEYDVNHPATGAGLFIVNDCYFAQFFSPSGVEPIPVDLVFVIDVSGSMTGRKIEQTREATQTIINQLRPEDRFTIVTFESEVGYWKQSLVSAEEFRQQGAQFASGLQAGGGTNFNGGLLAGAEILKLYANPSYIQLLVILTDGQPTVGVTGTSEILDNARTALSGTKISLNCLGFGLDLNFDLLVRLALSNNGIARRIYEDDDAAEQLEGFFEEISSPILHSITVTYQGGLVEEITETAFPILFNGSEIVVAGRFSCDAPQSVTVQVTGSGASQQQLTFESQVSTNADTLIAGRKPSIERLAAYLFIQQLLDRRTIAEEEDAIEAIEQEALDLALKYNFVTELTSLIVIEEPGMEDGGARNFTLGEGTGGGGLDEEAADVFLAAAPCCPATNAGGRPGIVAASAESNLTVGVLVGVVVGSVLGVSALTVLVVLMLLAVRHHRRKRRGRYMIANPSASHVPLSASNKLAQEANTPLWNDSPVISTHGGYTPAPESSQEEVEESSREEEGSKGSGEGSSQKDGEVSL